MIKSVIKKNFFVVLLAIVFATFSLAPSTSAYPYHRRYYRHYRVYHHHSKLKGALIGGAAGAVIGGIAGHGAGALIGGAAGAGAGYLIQRHRNRRHRYYHRY